MRLAAVYNVWFDGIEILPFSIAAIEDLVDEVVIVYSNTSNHGQTIYYVDQLAGLGTIINWEPNLGMQPTQNEIAKRNFALEAVRALGFTHFIMLDCDECYDPDEFEDSKQLMKSDINGLIHPLKVYVKSPTLQCADHTLVPGIHRLTRGLHYELGSKAYPFAYDAAGHAHIDPTRRLNVRTGVTFDAKTTMHHFSHVRRDINLKINNSTAKNSLLKSSIFADIEKAAPGVYCDFYRDTLKEVPNQFGIKL